ncbi:winged helix DNA-binding protein [uncultured Proteiniphilum sp.]|uniref:MarR family winged helix-turn-helix transcriptional regulator n=1 Tax=uncultured Proteiniphilum sp. TaxID=497637 RepID=UPI00262CDC4F|nr:winged helix DNA-binding protein [uncultured Proteiniphilum sp.]
MELICRLKDIYKTLYAYEKQFSEQTGITINEGALLCCLKDDKPKSANELCDFIGLSGSRVSRIIHTMEEKGFILREIGASDKRQMIFTLTDSGRKKIKEMKKHNIDIDSLLAQLIFVAK